VRHGPGIFQGFRCARIRITFLIVLWSIRHRTRLQALLELNESRPSVRHRTLEPSFRVRRWRGCERTGRSRTATRAIWGASGDDRSLPTRWPPSPAGRP
jgi:hypothetical protein